MTLSPRIVAALFALALAACGQKGPLYLPDTTRGEVVTRSTQTPTETSNSPATPDTSGQSASPAPEVTAPEATAAPPPDAAAEAAASEEKKKQNGASPPK
jgi:predicted small lipoprotein YifL